MDDVIDPKPGDRVFHRRRDLFGTVVEVDYRLDEDRALVKYEWPWDPKAPPESVAVKELSWPPTA